MTETWTQWNRERIHEERQREADRIALLGDGLDLALQPLRDSGYCRAIVHYRDGRVWLWMRGCYDGCGRTSEPVRRLFEALGEAGVALAGHDDSGLAFGRRCGKAHRVERLQS